MSSWQIILPWLAPLLTLALLSCLFSGSEAALFSLRDRDLKTMRRRGRSGQMVVKLLEQPERLLSAILFWNLLVNMLCFGIAGVVSGRLEEESEHGGQAAIVFSSTVLMFVIVFSEMLPKSIAVLLPKKIALAVALPMSLAVRVVSPALPLINVVNTAVQRLIWPQFSPEPEIDLKDIGRAIQLGTDDAALAELEQNALQNLVQLTEWRMDECMRPRSQLMLVKRPIDTQTFESEFPPGGYALVLDDDDEIHGTIAVTAIRPTQLLDLEAVIEPVCYVPWSANISVVLDLLQRQRLSVAVAVNEFGESIGSLSIEDIMHHVLTSRFQHMSDDAQAPVLTVSPGVWRVNGAVSIRKLCKVMDLPIPEGRSASVATLMQRQLERPPKLGDRCEWNEYLITVVQELEGNCVMDVCHIDAADDVAAKGAEAAPIGGLDSPNADGQEATS